jgi:hypothetical protein
MKATVLAALVTLAGASLLFAESPASPQPTTASTNAPPADTLGFLETRDCSVEIKAGDSGSYTVRTMDGKILAERISASQLQAQFPQLHQILRYGYARNSDARLNLNPAARRILQPADNGDRKPLMIRRATWNTDASVSIVRSATWNNDASMR